MKIGFNEGCNRFCENHSVLEDLDLCEKYGFDYIDIQSECLDREIVIIDKSRVLCSFGRLPCIKEGENCVCGRRVQSYLPAWSGLRPDRAKPLYPFHAGAATRCSPK